MNKNVRRMIVITLAMGIISSITPIAKINLLTTKAYASDEKNDETTLDSLELRTSSGSNLRLYEDDDYDSDDRIDSDEIDEGETYYAKTSSQYVNIDIGGPSAKYVKVFKGTSNSANGKSISNDIYLSSGTTTLTVRVYSEKPDSDVRYDDDYESQYKIKVKYTGKDADLNSEDQEEEEYDDIYLERLSIDGKSLDLINSKTTYTYDVSNEDDEVTIKAVPEDDYIVTIDNEDVDEDDNYKTTVDLNKGENKIKVEIEDGDNNYREYTLKINRGILSSNANTSIGNNISSTRPNQWIQVNGRWQYNDATGKFIKNSWFYDRSYGKNYFLRADGSMATGWLNYNGKWYYLGMDGGMKTGWIIDGGRCYYLYSDGSMAYNTIIGGFKLGADGAWVR